MNRLFFLCLALFAFTRFAGAHPWAPPDLNYVAGSDTIYVVKAISSAPGPDSVHPGKITFVITEVLRGEAKNKLVLLAYEDDPFKENTEWIIFHNPSGFKGCVGWAMEGDCEWLPIQVTRDGDKANAQWIGPLDKVREYLAQHPKKP